MLIAIKSLQIQSKLQICSFKPSWLWIIELCISQYLYLCISGGFSQSQSHSYTACMHGYNQYWMYWNLQVIMYLKTGKWLHRKLLSISRLIIIILYYVLLVLHIVRMFHQTTHVKLYWGCIVYCTQGCIVFYKKGLMAVIMGLFSVNNIMYDTITLLN